MRMELTILGAQINSLMQEFSVRLFKGAYTINAKTEQRFLFIALAVILFDVCLLVFLLTLKGFSTVMLAVYLLHLPIVGYFMARAWLDSKPRYRRHLTLTIEGVRYRAGHMKKEREFDWEEIDMVKLELFRVTFLLKNEESHTLNLETIQHAETLQAVKDEIRKRAKLKQVDLY